MLTASDLLSRASHISAGNLTLDIEKRVDVTGAPHTNKITQQQVNTPHVDGKNIPGGVRSAKPEEIPKWRR